MYLMYLSTLITIGLEFVAVNYALFSVITCNKDTVKYRVTKNIYFLSDSSLLKSLFLQCTAG